jgi:ATP-dependent RNA helicase RhlE
VELISQVAYPVGREQKRELLAHLVKSNNWQQVLVFTRTKHGANRLAQQLERDGIDADAIHGNKSQGARTRALKRFKDNELQVLVATDIAARGLDIEELPHVVNYDLPHVAEDYVHRIGRTGRAGASGEAVSLVSTDDRPLLAAIERLIGRRIEQKTAAGFEGGSQSAAPASGEVQQNHRPQQERGRREAAPARHGNNGHRRQDGRRQQESRNEPRSHGHGHNGQGRSGQRERPQQPAQPGRDGGNRTQEDRNGNRNEPRRSPQGQRDGQQRPRASQPGQSRHESGGNRPPRRQEPRVPAYGQSFANQPSQTPRDEERQPAPERARNQLFPAFLGNLFGRKGR